MPNIRIDAVRVAGFRGISRLQMELDRITVLLGTNNSGKTSMLKALQLSLGDYSRFLSEEDLHIGSDEQRASEILVDLRIVPMSDGDVRPQSFADEWAMEFGDAIKAEADGAQYVALRTRSKPSMLRTGFETERYTLEQWPDWTGWPGQKVHETKSRTRVPSIAYVSIEAQRDIHQDLKDRSSFVGRVLSGVDYDPDEIAALEHQIKQINDRAVDGSADLKKLKEELQQLTESFLGSDSVELTPFPKKIRDLSKHFSLHAGNQTSGTFSMEYHGMGTRSWASMLALKAFTEIAADRRAAEEEPFFPLIAAEEPEAHLHPNAQRALYRQLADMRGQVVLTTHSPYLSAAGEPSGLRHLRRDASNGVMASKIGLDPGTEDYRRFYRQVIHSRGEILFCRALILCEGETEEQAIPEFFKKHFSSPPFARGVNVVGVGGSGSRYTPFLTFARDSGIPAFIFSDGEEGPVRGLRKAWKDVFGDDHDLDAHVTILDGMNFESYLVRSGYASAVEGAICEVAGDLEFVDKWIGKNDGQSLGRERTQGRCETCGQDIYRDILRDYTGDDGRLDALVDILKSAKTLYAPVVASKLCEQDDLPSKVVEFFESMREECAS